MNFYDVYAAAVNTPISITLLSAQCTHLIMKELLHVQDSVVSQSLVTKISQIPQLINCSFFTPKKKRFPSCSQDIMSFCRKLPLQFLMRSKFHPEPILDDKMSCMFRLILIRQICSERQAAVGQRQCLWSLFSSTAVTE